MSVPHSQEILQKPSDNNSNTDELLAKYDPEFRVRIYTGPMKNVVKVLAISWALFQLYVTSFGSIDAIIARAWFLAFLLTMIFLLMPATKKEKRIRALPTLWDMLCIAGSFVSVGYLITNYYSFVTERAGIHVPLDYVFGGIGIFLAFEASRRAVGLILTLLTAAFFIYNFLGQYIPGIFGHAGLSFNRVIDAMWWTDIGIFGSVIGVASTYVFVFVLFGAFLRAAGFMDFINNISLAITGGYSGGAAKVAIFASGMMGTINGSGVANATTVGTVTIPLMKKTGYKPHFAAGVEAASGTGGVIAPPVMGAAAFIMAELIGVSYTTIAIAAIIPAILYFLTIFISVHFEAKKLGLEGLPKESLPRVIDVLKKDGIMVIPIVVLVGSMIMGFTPLYAAVWALVSTIVLSWFRKENKLGIKKILLALEEGSRGVMTVGAACAIVGIIVGTISLTSLGLTVGNNILSLAGNNLFLIALLTALISIVLGMGVPVSASYIITATISAPLLLEMGTPIIVAHMFAFFFAALSDITPPVALASMASAGIAGASPLKTALTSCRLGIVGFIIPFFFLYNPVLLIGETTSIWVSILACFSACLGVICLSGAFSNWFLYKTNIVQRIFLFVSAFLLIYPEVLTTIIGLSIGAIVFYWQKFTLSKVPNQSLNRINHF